HERLGILAVLRADRDADGDRDLVLAPLDVEGPLQSGDDLLRDMSRAALVRTRKNERELVAAETRHRIGLAQVGGDASGDFADEKVTRGVAERVVDLLKAIEVHHQKCERRRETSRRPQSLLETIQKQRAVWKTGERVVQGEPFELVLGLFAIGHVGKARNDLANPAQGVLYRDRIDEEP